MIGQYAKQTICAFVTNFTFTTLTMQSLALSIAAVSTGLVALEYALACMKQKKKNFLIMNGSVKPELFNAADPKFKEYMTTLSQRYEFATFVEQFRKETATPIVTAEHRHAVMQVLLDIRQSPFYSQTFSPEYDAMWIMILWKKNEMPSTELLRILNDMDVEIWRRNFVAKDREMVSLETIADALKKKMLELQ